MMLVILPGLLCDARMFESQLDAFPHSICIDGFYGSCTSIEDMAMYALKQIPGQCTLFGHSMGARVALEVLRIAPERVERLIIADTGIHPVRPGEREKRYALRDLGRVHGIEKLVDNWLPPMLGEKSKLNDGLVRQLRTMSISAGLGCYDRQMEALLSRPEVETLLPKVRCPTLVLVGSEDAWSSVEQHRVIAGSVLGAQLEVIDHAGHMMPAEQPAKLNEVLQAWMASSVQNNFQDRTRS